MCVCVCVCVFAYGRTFDRLTLHCVCIPINPQEPLRGGTTQRHRRCLLCLCMCMCVSVCVYLHLLPNPLPPSIDLAMCVCVCLSTSTKFSPRVMLKESGKGGGIFGSQALVEGEGVEGRRGRGGQLPCEADFVGFACCVCVCVCVCVCLWMR